MANIPEKRKVAFFVWTAAPGRIQIVDNLRKHHILIFDWCCVCSGESIDHLLFHCSMASGIWSFYLYFGWALLGWCSNIWFNFCNAVKIGFSALEEPRCGEPCPCASCGINGLKETDGSLMASKFLSISSMSIFCGHCLIGYMLQAATLHVFCWFYWHSFILSCILWIQLVHILCVFPFSFSNTIITYQEKETCQRALAQMAPPLCVRVRWRVRSWLQDPPRTCVTY